jgi:hypothetical protein
MGSYLNSLIGYATTTMPFLVSGTVAGTRGRPHPFQLPTVAGQRGHIRGHRSVTLPRSP